MRDSAMKQCSEMSWEHAFCTLHGNKTVESPKVQCPLTNMSASKQYGKHFEMSHIHTEYFIRETGQIASSQVGRTRLHY
jgi:hypothetical protein